MRRPRTGVRVPSPPLLDVLKHFSVGPTPFHVARLGLAKRGGRPARGVGGPSGTGGCRESQPDTRPRPLGLALLSLVLAACGGGAPTPTAPSPSPSTSASTNIDANVDVGGRTMHLVGPTDTGEPTILLEAGGGGDYFTRDHILPASAVRRTGCAPMIAPGWGGASRPRKRRARLRTRSPTSGRCSMRPASPGPL